MAFIYNLTDTWNNAAISFNGIKLNATDTASSVTSKLLDLQINGSSKLVVGKTGNVTATGLIESTVDGFRFPDGTTQTTKATVNSVSGTGSVNGITLTGSVTNSGSLTLGGTLGNIANSQLTNSAITINGTSTALGGSIAVGTVTSVGGTGTVSGLSLTGSITTSGSLTLGGTLVLTSGQVTDGLGYTPYNATNPTGYITAAALTPYLTSATAATTYQPLDGDLTAIAALAGTPGLIRKTAANTYALDTAVYITGITSGDVTTALGFTPATAAQGAKADTAVQTIASADGSVTITGTTAIDLSVPVTAATNSVILPVRNTTGATLTKGTAVYISGATGQISTVSKALATSDATSAQTLGLITANLANNTNGNVTLIGTISNIDTSAYTDGAQLYLSPTTAGTLTATKPYAPQHLVYIAIVEHAHPSQGKLFVKVQNGYEMDELHNVSAQSPANNDGLFYNTTTSLWEKKSIVTALGYTPYNATNPAGYTTNTGTVTSVNLTAGTGVSVSGGPITTSGAITVTNTAPDQVVSLTGAGTTTVTGTYPNFTVTSNDSTVGTVTSVGGTGTVSGLTLSGTVTTSGNLTLGGTLAVTPSNFASQTANTVLAAPNGSAGTPAFRSIVAADIPTLNQNTTGTAANVTGTVAVTNGGTGTATAFTAGSVVFAGASGVYTQDNANLFWDNTNDRLGIGTSSPASKLDIGSGDLRFSSTGQRIIGNMSSGTLANRLAFQSSILNTSTGVHAIPNGSSVVSGFRAESDSAFANGQFASMDVNGGTDVRITSGIRGSGTYVPLTFYMNGVEAMRMSITGNVGIGTSSPAIKLQVSDLDQATARIGVQNVNGQNYQLVAGNPGASNTGFAIFDATASATRMYLDSSGNFGIGTTSPGTKLDVNGQTRSTSLDAIGSLASFASGGGLANYYSGSGIGVIRAYSNNAGAAGTLTFNASGAENMRIDTSGNVGIGTSSPGTKLTVAGASEAIRMANATPYLSFYNAAQSTRFGYIQHNGTNLSLVNGEAGSLEMYTSNTLRATLNSSGNVLVGTTTDYGGRLTLIPAANPTTASASTNQIAIGESSANSAYRLNIGYIFTGGYASSIQSIAGGVGANLLLNADGGNVGIGASSPSFKLDVQGNSAVTATFVRSRNNDATSASFAGYGCSTGEGVNAEWYSYSSANTFGTKTNHPQLFITNNTERARITAAGLVGIGVTNPGYPLAVASNASGGTIRIVGRSADGIGTLEFSSNDQATTQAYIQGGSTPYLLFGTSTTERMRITSAGYLEFPNSTFSRPGSTGQYIIGAANGGFYQQDGATYWLVTTAGGSTSDATLKKNVQQLNGALQKICAVRGVTFEFIEQPLSTADCGTQIGVIAQEIEAQFPEIVVTHENGTKAVRYDRLVAPLIEAIKELTARVAQLEGN